MIIPEFVIAGAHSGCGKTTVTLGIMAALVQRGYVVQPFKTGPDFIDPGHHRRVTGRASHNLDGWILDRANNRALFERSVKGADVAVVEGAMGLFDGFAGNDEAGSTAQIAKWLGLPVILVIDVRAMARSAAALATGYARFDPDLSIKGVVLNRVGSDRHRLILQDAMQAAGIKLYGCLPYENEIVIPSRHLGLVTDDDFKRDPEQARVLSSWIEKHLDLNAMIRDVANQKCYSESSSDNSGILVKPEKPKVRIGIARDRAFCFYYQENLRLLQESGGELIAFSPLDDKGLPQGIQGLYIGGGYPELYCRKLSENSPMLKAIREFSMMGGPVYAECGGFMYLMKELFTAEDESFSMCGVFDLKSEMTPRLKALGYREVATGRHTILGPKGIKIRGHEFHYSQVRGDHFHSDQIYEIRDRTGSWARGEGYIRNNTLGSYVHLHWGSNRNVASNFVAFCREANIG
jgi:cobyrinic acid a,c-diamide synthase